MRRTNMNTQAFRLSLLVLATLLVLGCQSHETHGDHASDPAQGRTETADASTQEVADHAMPAAEHVHGLRCGCAVEGVGQCGNYIEVDGEFVELVLPAETAEELGEMPFCGKTDLVANVEGEIVDGKFVATEFEYVER
jgi:hypothetical protein